MDAIGYIRKSKKDQSNYSLEYQENHIREYCKWNGVELKALFVDDGESSYTFDRPDYMALENFIRQHRKSVRYLIVFDHDRFSRNLPEALMKIDELEKKFSLKVVATNESLDIDPSDPSVFMQRAFKYLIANQELFTIRRRARMGMRQAQSSGRYVNRAPFGYLNAKENDGKGIMHIDESNAFIVQKIFRDYLSSIPVYLIYKSVRELGFPQTGHSSIIRILRNPLYAGLVRVTGTDKEPERLVKGLHQAIISEEQYWRAHEMVNDKRPMKTQPKEEFPLKGVLKSPCCGGNMTAGWTKGKLKYYLYYRCIKHPSINISGTLLHQRFNDLLDQLSFNKEQVKEITSRVTEGLKSAMDIRQKQLKVKEEQLASAEDKLSRAEEKFMNDEINGDTYKKWSNKYSQEQARLKEEINYLHEDVKGQVTEELKLLPNLLNLRGIFQKATVNQQHAILRSVFKDSLVFREGAFRTPSINPEFEDKLLTLKERGLLFLERPSDLKTELPHCGD